MTADVRACPDHAEVTSFLTKPSGCAGSAGSNHSLCREKLGGVYCRACSAEFAHDHYYHAAERECLECVRSASGGVWLLAALLGCTTVALLVGRFARGQRLQLVVNKVVSLWRRVSNSSVIASLLVTVKTLISFFQIVSEVEEVFIMELPVTAVRFIKSFSWLDLSISDLIQLECMGLGGYVNELQLTAAAPVPLLLILAAYALIYEAVKEKRRGWELARGAALRALPSALFVTFLVVPDISSLAFRAFRCECFGEEGWLRADYSLQCSVGGCEAEHFTDEYVVARRTSWAVLWVYALGVPSVYVLLLLHERQAIMDGVQTPLVDALAFLHNDYKPSCYLWELVNLAQKLFVVGFATLILPGKLMQLVIVMLSVAVFLLLLVVARPYKSKASGLLALVEQNTVLLFFIVCFIVKAEQLASLVTDWMTDELHKRFFYDTELIASTMLCTLMLAVTAAALVSLHQTAPVAMDLWEEAMAFGLVDHSNAEKLPTETKAARRAKARERLRVVLSQRAATLEVREMLYSDEAEMNPVMRLRVAESKDRARPRHARSSREGGAASSALPKQRVGGDLRRLNLGVNEARTEQTTESRARALQIQLRRYHGVNGLVSEDAAPEEVGRVRRRLRAASRKAPLTNGAQERQQLRQLALFRDRLESRGWSGAEQISPRTRWQLQMQKYKQQRSFRIDAAGVDNAADGNADADADAMQQAAAGTVADESRTSASRTSVGRRRRRSLVPRSMLSQSEKMRNSCASDEGSATTSRRGAKRSAVFSSRRTQDPNDPRALSRGGKDRGSSASVASSIDFAEDTVGAQDALPPMFAPGDRVVHGTHGPGVVAELLEGGRTKVVFDSGEEHRYKPSSMYKLEPEDQVDEATLQAIQVQRRRRASIAEVEAGIEQAERLAGSTEKDEKKRRRETMTSRPERRRERRSVKSSTTDPTSVAGAPSPTAADSTSDLGDNASFTSSFAPSYSCGATDAGSSAAGSMLAPNAAALANYQSAQRVQPSRQLMPTAQRFPRAKIAALMATRQSAPKP